MGDYEYLILQDVCIYTNQRMCGQLRMHSCGMYTVVCIFVGRIFNVYVLP